MTIRHLAGCLAAAAALAAAGGAAAEEQRPWYVSASGGLSLLNDTGGTIANAPVAGSTVVTQNDLKTGWGLQAAVGRQFGRFRLEAELGYTRNTQDSYTAITPATGKIAADVKDSALRGMVNGYVDLGGRSVRPYVGAGLVVARLDVDFFAPRAPFPAEAPRQLIKGSDTRFAYQLMAGAAVPLSDSTDLTLQYRWFDAGTSHINDVRGEVTTRRHAGSNIDVGLRFRF